MLARLPRCVFAFRGWNLRALPVRTVSVQLPAEEEFETEEGRQEVLRLRRACSNCSRRHESFIKSPRIQDSYP